MIKIVFEGGYWLAVPVKSQPPYHPWALARFSTEQEATAWLALFSKHGN